MSQNERNPRSVPREQEYYEQASEAEKTRGRPASAVSQASQDHRHHRRRASFANSQDGKSEVNFEEDEEREDFVEQSHVEGEPPLTQWPPEGYPSRMNLSPRQAAHLICDGVATFHGHCAPIPHAPKGYFRYFATSGKRTEGETDRAVFQNDTFKSMSFRLTGGRAILDPWETLEQPSMSFCYGRTPGTVTLNGWIASSGSLQSVVQFGTKVKPRRIGLLDILDRLRFLEVGLEEDGDLLYRSLYGNLIHDPEKKTNPHFAMERQISDLITVLSHPDWIDFSQAKNQVVAKFFTTQDQPTYRHFFLQLLLSVELHLRIHSADHLDWAKRKLLPQLPPKIAWDLAVAQRWLSQINIEKPKVDEKQSSINFKLLHKQRHKDVLKNFARTLKWPNMAEIEYVLKEHDPKEQAVEDRSADAMSWFSGVILPGRTMSWILMNSLIDCDRDTEEKLRALTHMFPNSGFQYRANTYWSSDSIVGKVLGAAKGVRQICGWIGPCYSTPDLKRVEIARIAQKQLSQCHSPKDVESMSLRSDPLGMADTSYPIEDYDLILPDFDDITDTIRVERLGFDVSRENKPDAPRGRPLTFDACVVFAIKGSSIPMPLTYDVSFVNAYPCKFGPHVLFYDYGFRIVNISALQNIKEWGNFERGKLRPDDEFDYNDVKEVLLIEAFGNPDNEVFARAWCARWGLSAVTGNVYKTCIACCIREAYAACVSVVILNDGRQDEEVDE